MKNINLQFVIVVSLVLFSALTRIIPHPWNFTAISAMALLAGNKNKSLMTAILLPWLALFLTDLVLGFHVTMVYVYAAVAIIAILAQKITMNKPQHYVLSSLTSSLIFFVITNFGVWFSTGFYTQDFKGLAECFIMALPFFKNQVIGDLFYTGILFSISTVVSRQFAKNHSAHY